MPGMRREMRNALPACWPDSEFQSCLKEANIEGIRILPNHIEDTFKQSLPDGRTRFIAVRVDPDLARDLAQ